MMCFDAGFWGHNWPEETDYGGSLFLAALRHAPYCLPSLEINNSVIFQQGPVDLRPRVGIAYNDVGHGTLPAL